MLVGFFELSLQSWRYRDFLSTPSLILFSTKLVAESQILKIKRKTKLYFNSPPPKKMQMAKILRENKYLKQV